jgi:hypothetical protein
MITPTVLANFNRGPSYLACAAIWRQSVPALAAPPQVGISFSNLTEAIEATVHGMGFVSDTHGRFKYFSAIDLNQAAARATKRQKRGEAAGSLWALAED